MPVEHIKADLEGDMGEEVGESAWAPFREYCLSALENHGEYAFGILACHLSMHLSVSFSSHNTFHLSSSVAQAKVTKAMPAYHCFFFFFFSSSSSCSSFELDFLPSGHQAVWPTTSSTRGGLQSASLRPRAWVSEPQFVFPKKKRQSQH